MQSYVFVYTPNLTKRILQNSFQFILPVMLINFGLSDYVDLTPRRDASLHIGVSSDMSFKSGLQNFTIRIISHQTSSRYSKQVNSK